MGILKAVLLACFPQLQERFVLSGSVLRFPWKMELHGVSLFFRLLTSLLHGCNSKTHSQSSWVHTLTQDVTFLLGRQTSEVEPSGSSVGNHGGHHPTDWTVHLTRWKQWPVMAQISSSNSVAGRAVISLLLQFSLISQKKKGGI